MLVMGLIQVHGLVLQEVMMMFLAVWMIQHVIIMQKQMKMTVLVHMQQMHVQTVMVTT